MRTAHIPAKAGQRQSAFTVYTVDPSIIVEPDTEPLQQWREKLALDAIADETVDDGLSWREWLAQERERTMELTTVSTKRGRKGGSAVDIDLTALDEDTLGKLAKTPNAFLRIDPEDYEGKVSPVMKVISEHVESLGFKASFGLTKAQRQNVEILADGTTHVVPTAELDELPEDSERRERIVPAGTLFVRGRIV